MLLVCAVTPAFAFFAWPLVAQTTSGAACSASSGSPDATGCANNAASSSLTSATITELQQHIPAGSKIMITKTLPDAATAKTALTLSEELAKQGYQIVPQMNISLGYPYFNGVKVEAPHTGYNNTGYYRLLVGDKRS
ncbi:MAG: hypothetical protein JO001_07905 [Alphaproteobacteria bacterium]|nr:hypothetical protein [Alphaproteobacteria bacterium]